MNVKRRSGMAAVACLTVLKRAGRNGCVRSAGGVWQTALTGLLLLTVCGCAVALPGAATRGHILPAGFEHSHAAPDANEAADRNRREKDTSAGPQLAAEDAPPLPPLPATAEAITSAPSATQTSSAVRTVSGTSSSNGAPGATASHCQNDVRQEGPPLRESDQGERSALTDIRIAALEAQVQWLRGDIARLQQLLNSRTADETEANRTNGGSVRGGRLPSQRGDELRAGIAETSRSLRDQQSTIDALNRRVATLEAAFVGQQTREVRALDDVIAGMEQLLQLQTKQMTRTSHAGQERRDARR